MSTDAVTERLRSLGAATDPAGDPIRPDEVRDRSGATLARGSAPVRPPDRRRHRVLALGAVAAAVAVLSVLLVIQRNGAEDTGPSDVVTGSTTGPPTNPTAVAPLVHLRFIISSQGLLPKGVEGAVQQVDVRGPSGTMVSGDLDDVDPDDGAAADRSLPTEEEAVLVLDRDVEPGTYRFRWRAVPCGPEGCPSTVPDIDEAATSMGSCAVDVAVRDSGWKTVVIDALRSGPPSCRLAPGDPPALTVPPGWSLRPTRPARCGDDGLGSLSVPLFAGAPDPTRAPRTCLATAAAAGEPTELHTWDPLTGGTVRPMVVRVAGAGRPVQVIRPGADGRPWTEQTCGAVTALDAYPWIRLDGCGAERTMPMAR